MLYPHLARTPRTARPVSRLASLVHRGFATLALAAALLTLASLAWAVTRTTTQSGNWSAATTWGGNPPPIAIDDVIVNGGFTVTIDVPNAACQSLQLGGSTLGTGAGTVAFNAGSHLTVTGPVTLGVTNNTPGSVNMAAGGTLTCDRLVDTRLGTWTPGTGTVEFGATNTIPTNNNIDFNNLTVNAGTTNISRNMTIAGNVLILPGATLNCGANIVTTTGNWVNNGTFTGSTGTLSFTKNGNQSVTGTGAYNFNSVRVSLGLLQANTLEVNATTVTAPDGFLQLQNGTFKISGTSPLTNNFILGPAWNIPPTAGLWINDPNVTVTPQAASASVRGLLRVSAGTVNVGTTTDEGITYQSGGSTIVVEGGTLVVAGRIAGNNATAVASYSQSGGTVTVAAVGSTDLVSAPFDLSVVGSSFTHTGGTLVIRNAGSSPQDYRVNAGSGSVTGGVLQIGDALSNNAQVIRINTTRPVASLLVSNATAQATKPTAQLVGASLNVAGGITLQAGTTLDAAGQGISLGGDWVDAGSFVNPNSVTFNGTGAQSLTRAGGETFGVLNVNKSGGSVTLGSNLTVTSALSLFQGSVAVGANTLTLNGGVNGPGSLTSGPTGTVIYNQSSAGQNVLAGAYGNLTFSNFDKVLASTGTIGVAGTFNPGTSLGHTVTGSTIDFNGGAQAIPAFAYHNLVTSGSGTKTASGTLSVAGNLTNGALVALQGASVLALNGTTHTNNGILSAATISVGAAATLTNNGTVTASAALGGAGTFAQGASAVLNLGGTAGIATLLAAAPANIVNYSGAGQTVAPVAYQNLWLSGSGAANLAGVNSIGAGLAVSGTVSATAGGPLAIGGDFTLASGAAFDAGTFAHSLGGNFTSAGTFTPGTSTFTLNGAGAQTLSGGAFAGLTIANAAGVSLLTDETVAGALGLSSGTFAIGAHTLTLNGALTTTAGTLAGGAASNLVIGGTAAAPTLPGLTLNNFTLNRAAGASLAADATVNGTLQVANGSLQTGANTVILGPAATLSEAAGQTVVGTVRTTRNVTATTGTETFGNIGADVALNGVALGSTTVQRRTGSASTGAGHASILRSFDVTPAVNTGLNAGLTLHYDASELSAQNASTLELFRSRDAGTTWNDLGGTPNAAARTIVATGLNDFSRWTAADSSNRIGAAPTPVTTSLSPVAKNVGDAAFTLTVNGTDFVNGKSVVRFNGALRPTTYVSATQLTAAIPAGDLTVVGPFAISVINNPGAVASNAQTFNVNALAPTQVRVETAANGSGTVVSAQSLASGASLTVFAVSRDPLNNFVANVSATWLAENLTGGVVAGDLVPAVDGKSAVFTAHVTGTLDIRATSGALTPTPSGLITVTPGAATAVRVETAANGSGTLVPAQSLPSGASVTGFAITRDASNNFVANVAASAWTLTGATGGVVAGDLVPAADAKSAVFTGHVIGSAAIRATSGALAATGSGVISVIPGAASAVRVETAADGSGTLVPAQSLVSGASVTGFAITRDASNNFVANVAASAWSLAGITGGVVAGDLVPAVDGKSAVFTGHGAGSAALRATSGALAVTNSGTITVTPGAAVAVRVETAADGSGTVLPAQSLASGASVTGFAITRDASNNFVANVAATAWSLAGITGGVVAGDLVPAADAKSAVFTGHALGSAAIRATSGALAVTNSGTITVTAGAATVVRVETAANGSGTVLPAQSLASGASVTGFAVTRDASGNFVANVAATAWNLTGATGGVVAGDLVPAADAKSAVFTGHVTGSTAIHATSGALATVSSGVITVTPGAASVVRVETAANGSGTVLPAQSLASGASVTGFAVTRDASNNFVANVAATAWSLAGATGGVVAGDLVPAADAKSAVFTGHGAGSAALRATSGALAVTNSGTITVTAGAATVVRVETAADGSGTLVPAQSLAAGASVTGFAITRDASNNFVANVAASAWSLSGVTGAVVAGDLVPAADGKSAVFTAHGTGSAAIHATSGALATVNSGVLTVTPGGAVSVRVETAADGSGTVLPAQSLVSGASVTGFAVTRDAAGNFVANVAATAWSLAGASGAVGAGDLVPAADAKSAVFTGHGVGSAAIRATSGALAATNSGTITVTPGAATVVRVETAADGSGTLLPAQSLPSGTSVTGFAVTRDASSNFVANVAASAWSLAGATGGVVAFDLVPAADAKSAVFTGHVLGGTAIRATSGVLTATNSGTITVTPGVATAVRVETAANGAGTLLPAQSLASGASVTGFAVTRDASGNFVANVAATAWSLANVTGAVVAGDLVPAADAKSAVFTGAGAGSASVRASSGVLAIVGSGTLTVTANVATRVRVETAADGSGAVVPAQSIASGLPVVMYAVARDAANNFVGNVAATWSTSVLTGGIVAGDLVPAPDGKSAFFIGHVVGTATVRAVSGALAVTPSGVITVTAGAATQVRVETAADGTGAVVAPQPLLVGSALTMYAITRDASNNFVANAAVTTWTLEGLTGGVLAGDLVPAADKKSATFTAHAVGTGAVRANLGVLVSTPSGLLTVTTQTAVGDAGPLVFSLGQNFPNPVHGATTIRFSVPRDGHVSLRVFDVTGREVATLLDDNRIAGRYTVQWASPRIPSGTYFYRLQGAGQQQVRKMLVMQ